MAHNPPTNPWLLPKLKHWAEDGRILRVHCNLYRRTLHFYAADLIEVYNPEMVAKDFRPPCSKCGKVDYVKVSSRLPGPDDIGHTLMRRPKGIAASSYGATSTMDHSR